MKKFVIYDSYYGNTKKIAELIAETLGENTRFLNATDALNMNFSQNNLIVLGSPTRAFSPSSKIKKLLKSNNFKNLQGVYIATFDTRMDVSLSNSKMLKVLAKKFGYAKEKMEKKLLKRGAVVVTGSAHFYVTDMQGPLAQSEELNAKKWATEILNGWQNKGISL